MPAVSHTGQLAVIGHLPARLEPGSWASPGPSSSTETQPRPPGQARPRYAGIKRATGRDEPPEKKLRTADSVLSAGKAGHRCRP
jgi:hypothetical protein